MEGLTYEKTNHCNHTQNRYRQSGRAEVLLCFPNFIHCVSACGGIPIQLNNLEGTVSAADVEEILNHVDGVIFSGGPDIHPGLFGEELMDCCGALAPERDALEIPLMQKAIEMNKPVLGVCRGFQVLNVATGGTLYQDINTQLKSSVKIEHRRFSVEDRDREVHKVNVIRDTPLHTFSEGLLQIGVNTLHHQAIKKLGEPLRSMAVADDGIIEAVYHPDKKFVMGVQWHPEILGLSNSISSRIFEAFIDACSKQD